MRKTLTTLVPVLNEEQFHEKSIQRLLLIEEIDQIFLIDDCSTDNSLNIMKDLENKHSKISVLESPYDTNKGKGSAISRAKELVATDYIIIHDADLEYDPQDIKKMYELISNNSDIFVMGSRFLKNNEVQLYYRTHFANKLFSKLFSIINNIKITDIATCYKLMPSHFFKTANFNEKGFAIEIEVVSRFLKISKNVQEVPISYIPRTYEEGKKIKLSDAFRYIVSIFKYKFNY